MVTRHLADQTDHVLAKVWKARHGRERGLTRMKVQARVWRKGMKVADS